VTSHALVAGNTLVRSLGPSRSRLPVEQWVGNVGAPGRYVEAAVTPPMASPSHAAILRACRQDGMWLIVGSLPAPLNPPSRTLPITGLFPLTPLHLPWP